MVSFFRSDDVSVLLVDLTRISTMCVTMTLVTNSFRSLSKGNDPFTKTHDNLPCRRSLGALFRFQALYELGNGNVYVTVPCLSETGS